jgi:hypothetical protein
MLLTNTAWVESQNTPYDRWGGVGKTYRSCQKHQSRPLRSVFPQVILLRASIITILKSNLWAALVTQNNCITSHPRNTTALHHNVFFTEYIGYWSHARDGALSPALTTAKVKCKIHSHHLYLAAVAMAWSLLDSHGNKLYSCVSNFSSVDSTLLLQSL